MSIEKYDVQLYEKANGDCPIQDFLDSLDDKIAAKMYGMIELLEENGPALSLRSRKIIPRIRYITGS